jgi:2-(1,2-epoxy-1,2-dihydrophenyl)acetyl-CoA isomerase
MSDPLVCTSFVETGDMRAPIAVIKLNRPERNNALIPQLIGELTAALDTVLQNGTSQIILCAAGDHFSTGGDIKEFAVQAKTPQAQQYAAKLVSGLQSFIVKMLKAPALITCVAQGAITGGSSGFVFAADHVIIEPTSFVQAYYREVGFGPDGGWCALLPELIGPKQALSIQLENKRLTAEDLLALGLASKISVKGSAFDDAVEFNKQLAACANIDAMIAVKKQIWHKGKCAEIKQRLEVETARFLELFDTPHMPKTLDNFNPAGAR